MKVGAIHATPTVVNGHVYFGTATYPAFYKLKPDGTIAWVYRIPKNNTPHVPQGGVNTINVNVGIVASALVTEKARARRTSRRNCQSRLSHHWRGTVESRHASGRLSQSSRD